MSIDSRRGGFDWLYPELRLFPTKRQAEIALSRASIRSGMSPFALLVMVAAFWVPWGEYSVHMSDLLWWMLVAYVCLAFSIVAWWGFRPRMRRLLRRELARSGVRICVKCGYDLRGLTELRCPECGAPSMVCEAMPPESSQH